MRSNGTGIAAARGIGLMLIGSALLLAGCSGGGAEPLPAPAPPPNPGPTGFGLDTRPSLGALAFPSGSVQSGDVRIARAFPNLTFQSPLYFAVAPGNRQHGFVVSQNGVIRVFDLTNPAATTSSVFLDIDARVTNDGGELGLLGLAFDPDYASNGYFYVNYNPITTDGSPLRTHISRFRVTSNPLVADPASETVLLRYNQPFANHNGGWLGFGPDRKLYIASGDGGAGGDPQGNGQNRNTLLGKMLRINPDGSIPADNPFVGQANTRGEIWAYGLRNPFRGSFDVATGNLWVGDVGQNIYEEIDVITRGGNYGWATREGLHGYPTASTPIPPGSNFIEPVLEYDHNAGCSVTGGTVYRGGAIPSLAGTYLYTDFCSGTLWSATPTDGRPATATVVGTIPAGPSSIAPDHDGELYATGLFDGALYRLLPNVGGGGSAPFPQRLSQTGLFTNTATMTPNPGLIEYQPAAEFWSDSSRKRRWFGIPNGTQVTFRGNAPWTFPPGSVTVKHFEITLANGQNRRLETRVFVNQSNGWQGYTYRWNADGSDADLLSTSATETLTVAGGGTQLYEYPSRAACATCHSAAAGFVLGVSTAQLNSVFAYPQRSDNQLRTLNHINLFTADIGNASQYPALVDPANASLSLTARARSYLDTNCAQCHQPNGPAPSNIDFRASTPIASTNLLGISPQNGDLGLTNARRIAPGRKESSVVWERMRRLDQNRMPPLASHVVDAAGVTLIGQWIDAGAN